MLVHSVMFYVYYSNNPTILQVTLNYIETILLVQLFLLPTTSLLLPGIPAETIRILVGQEKTDISSIHDVAYHVSSCHTQSTRCAIPFKCNMYELISVSCSFLTSKQILQACSFVQSTSILTYITSYLYSVGLGPLLWYTRN
jgi:hypothetical protein